MLVTGCGHGGGGSATIYNNPTPTPVPTPTAIPTYVPSPTYFPTPTPTYIPTPTVIPMPTVIPPPTPTQIVVANPLTATGVTNLTRDSVTLRGTVFDYNPYKDIVWSASATNPTYIHSSLVLGFQWGPFNADRDNINWSTEFLIPPFQLGTISTTIQGRLTPNTPYSYRVFLVIGEIRIRATNEIFGNTPLTWYTDVIDFTPPQ